jgi:hypothetical protein
MIRRQSKASNENDHWQADAMDLEMLVWLDAKEGTISEYSGYEFTKIFRPKKKGKNSKIWL